MTIRSAILGMVLLALCPAAARATTVKVQAHIQVYRNGASVDHYPGDTFDATPQEIAILLPTGAITLPGGGPALTGSDFSANPPALPAVGANFAASGPFAGWVLVKTIPASPARVSVDIENTSGAVVAVLRDDGTAAAGAAPTNASLFTLDGGSSVDPQGKAYRSTTFKGRLQIYAPSASAWVSSFVD